MIRVLQLRAFDCDYQTETGCRQLSGDPAGSIISTVRTIGRGGDYPSALAAIMSLRRGAEDGDLIHAWGQTALAVAALGSRRPIVYCPDTFPTKSAIRFVHAVIAVRDVQVIASTDTMRKALVTRGIPIAHCHLIRPGVEFARINRRRDVALRQRLGFANDDWVILACGESTRASAHKLAVWAGTVLHVLNPHDRLLIWGRGDHAAQAHRFAKRTHQFNLVRVAERELRWRVRFEALLPAADAILITAIAPVPTLPISISMAAGLPIVATVTPTIAELLEDRHTALLVGKPTPRLIARRLLDLKQDPSLQWSIGDMARTEAYEYFSLTRFLEQYRTVYRQVEAGENVEIAHHPAGAGLRFHGRA